MANLYQLTVEYQTLLNQLLETADYETGEVDIDLAKALEEAQGTFEEKAVAMATVYRIVGTEVDRVDAEIKRLKEIKSKYIKNQANLENALSNACTRTGITSIKGMYANISFRASEQTIIDNLEEVPKEYMRVKVTEEPNKTAIKAALKSGKEVAGAHLEQCNNIQIK